MRRALATPAYFVRPIRLERVAAADVRLVDEDLRGGIDAQLGLERIDGGAGGERPVVVGIADLPQQFRARTPNGQT